MNVSLQTIRCCSWSGDAVRSTHQVRAAACRALLAVTSHKCVRVTLAATKDCLHSLIDTLTPFVEGRKADFNFFNRMSGFAPSLFCSLAFIYLWNNVICL